MKKTKLSKILVFVLSLALLLGSAIGIAVSAAGEEDSQTYEIAYMNASYGERVQIVMAIDAPVAEAEAGNVVVKYSYGDYSDMEATYDSSLNVTIDGVTYPVFYTRGISPKDLGEDIIAEAHVNGAENYTPVEYNLSVAEYLYNLLYAQGKISAEDGTVDGNKKNLYLAGLNYAAMAQQSLYNDKLTDGETARVLVTDRSYVYATVATINGTAAKELLLPGKTGEVTLTATADAPTGITGWTVTTYAEDGTATTTNVMSNTVAITGHTVITPYVDPDILTFEGLSGETLAAPYSQNGVERITKPVATVLTLVTADGNTALKPNSYWRLWPSDDTSDLTGKNATVLEFEWNITESIYNKDSYISWKNSNNVEVFDLRFRDYENTDDGYLYFKLYDRLGNGSFTAYQKFIAEENHAVKFTLKLEYLWSGKLKVSINGETYGVYDVGSTDYAMKEAYFVMADSAATYTIDNIKYKNTYIDPTTFE